MTKVLKAGFVKYVDHMGSDEDIVNTARVCYDNKPSSDARTLLRYLLRHSHTSPFESSRLKLHVRLPIYVERQWARHRMAGWNEVSGRYTELPDDCDIPGPDEWRLQDQKNKQGSDGSCNNPHLSDSYSSYTTQVQEAYHYALSQGIAREQARTILPVSNYTEKIWWCDLHNLLHFLRLRLDSHAQYEIRLYAQAVADIVKKHWPLTWEAFVDYRLEAMTLTRLDIEALKCVLTSDDGSWKGVFTHVRERNEFVAKADKLGIKVS